MNQHAKLVRMSLSASDWEKEFNLVFNGNMPDWLKEEKQIFEDESGLNEDHDLLQLLSPMATKLILNKLWGWLAQEKMLDRKELESMRGSMMYLQCTYPVITPYIKGLHLMIE